MKPQNPRRRWFRFRLRTLLVMLMLLSVPLGWVGWELDQRRREMSAVAWVKEMGGYVHYSSNGSFNSSDDRNWWEKTKDNWLRKRVRAALLDDTHVIDLSRLAEFKHLEALNLTFTQVSDLSPLSDLKNLEKISISATMVSDLSPLAELKNLNYLGLSGCINVNDLSSLAEVEKLETLTLFDTPVSDEQVQDLRQALPNCRIGID